MIKNAIYNKANPEDIQRPSMRRRLKDLPTGLLDEGESRKTRMDNATDFLHHGGDLGQAGYTARS